VGRGVVFPRSGYAEAKGRPEFGKSGVYVVTGPSEDTGRERLYIGEGDPVRPRLDSHVSKKDFWTQGFIFTSKDDNLNKAHIQYLEARMLELAAAAKRAEIDNGNTPARPSLSEADQAELEAFLAEMLVCFPVLGLSAFERPVERATPAKLYVMRGPAGDARGFDTEEGFVVQAGAMVRKDETDAIPAHVSAMRTQLFKAGVIVDRGGKWVTAQDYLFSSPSTAAAVVLGRNANGRIEWKNSQGRTLKEVQAGEA
jgi:hypothetical protein